MALVQLYEFTTLEGKGIFSELDEQGVLTFVIWAGEGSSVRGTEMFNGMLNHFGQQVQAIRGVWRTNTRGEPSANIDKVNALTATGTSLMDAVKQAWTVTRAAKRGFNKVNLVGSPVGTPGSYSEIDILIEPGSSEAVT